MKNPTDVIVIVNRSTVLTDAQIKAVIPGVQAQVSDDFAPLWGIDAKVTFASPGPDGGWPLYVFDNTDTPGAGGYHVSEDGKVSGKVFAADAINGGEAWTVDLTHELLEMARDPSAGTDPSKFIALRGQYAGYHCLAEVGDAVEADEFAYTKAIPDPGFDVPGCARQDGKLIVTVTDFVLPQYFYEPAVVSPAWPKGAPAAYDFIGHLTLGPAPTLLYGGYLGLLLPDGTWSQVSAFKRDGTHSRRSRRHGRTAHAAAHAIDPNYDPYTSGQTASPDDGKDTRV